MNFKERIKKINETRKNNGEKLLGHREICDNVKHFSKKGLEKKMSSSTLQKLLKLNGEQVQENVKTFSVDSLDRYLREQE